MFHVRVRSGLLSWRTAAELNLDLNALETRILQPWAAGVEVRVHGRGFVPNRSRLEVLEGEWVEKTHGSERTRWERVARSGARDVTKAALRGELTDDARAPAGATGIWVFADRVGIVLAPMTAVLGLSGSRAAVGCGVIAVVLLAGPRVARAVGRARPAARWAMAAGTALLVAGLAAAGLWTQPGQDVARWLQDEQRPKGSTIAEIERRARSRGLRIVERRAVALRAEQPKLTLLILRSREAEQRSDELELWTPTASGSKELRRVLRFAPTSDAVYRGPVGQEVGGPGVPRPLVFAMRVQVQADLDGAPGQEVVFDLREFGAQAVWPRPLHLRWDAENSAYVVEALLSPRSTGLPRMGPSLDTSRLTAEDFAGARIAGVYSEPTKIKDRSGTVPILASYAVEAYVARPEPIQGALGDEPGGLLLGAGYAVRERTLGTPELLQVIAWHVDLRQVPARARADLSPPRVVSVGSRVDDLDGVVEDALP